MKIKKKKTKTKISSRLIFPSHSHYFTERCHEEACNNRTSSNDYY